MREITEWTTLQFLGRGSSATVHLANSSSQFLAAKSSPLSLSLPLQNEQKFLSSLSSPFIISLLGRHVSTSTFTLFLEYAPLGPITRHVTPSSLPSLTCEILLGLSYLHSLGIAHCDIKPDNILIGSDNTAKIADFGCARYVHAGDVAHKQVISGTPGFMAPEVARAEQQGTPADVWALGCTVLQLVTGSPVWGSGLDPVSVVYRVGFGDLVPEIPKWVSGECRDFLEKCFVRDPNKRWSADLLLKHPFVVAGSGSGLDPIRWVSPRSVLDRVPGMWDSLTDVDDDVADEEEMAGGDDVVESIRQMADFDWMGWSLSGEWVTVRSAEVEFDEPAGSDMVVTDEVEFSCNYLNFGFIYSII